METAMSYASRPHDFKLLVQGEGRTGTSMEDVEQADEPAQPSRSPADLIPGL
jgi:twitching motility protein PilT